LLAILDEWSRDEPIDVRIDHLSGTAPGGWNDPYFFVRGATVHDDGQWDTMTGGRGSDWFLAFDDKLRDFHRKDRR
jgi:hypothetical protein